MAGVMHGKIKVTARAVDLVDDSTVAQPRATSKRREYVDTPRRPIPPMA